jgi:hypothetical protein
VHADPEWRQRSLDVCVGLGDYVHELNTHPALYSALDRAVGGLQEEATSRSAARAAAAAAAAATAAAAPSGQAAAAAFRELPGGASSLEDETLLVGRLLLRDFRRFGVHLAGAARERVTALVQRTQRLGMEVTRNLADPGRLGVLALETQAAGEQQRCHRQKGGAGRGAWRRGSQSAPAALRGGPRGRSPALLLGGAPRRLHPAPRPPPSPAARRGGLAAHVAAAQVPSHSPRRTHGRGGRAGGARRDGAAGFGAAAVRGRRAAAPGEGEEAGLLASDASSTAALLGYAGGGAAAPGEADLARGWRLWWRQGASTARGAGWGSSLRGVCTAEAGAGGLAWAVAVSAGAPFTRVRCSLSPRRRPS